MILNQVQRKFWNPENILNKYYIYILANQRNGTLYVGVTNNLRRRIYEHKNNLVSGFSQKYKTHSLVYFEGTPNIESAIVREKRLKSWHRAWKVQLIESTNPDWQDLYEEIVV